MHRHEEGKNQKMGVFLPTGNILDEYSYFTIIDKRIYSLEIQHHRNHKNETASVEIITKEINETKLPQCLKLHAKRIKETHTETKLCTYILPRKRITIQGTVTVAMEDMAPSAKPHNKSKSSDNI